MKFDFISGKSILIVEDEIDLLDIFEENLTLFGCTVQKAKNGQEALKLILNNKFDFILSDIRMPELDGTELLKALKLNFEQLPKFIFLSGQTNHSDEELKLMGAVDVLHKPFNLNQLADILYKHIHP